MSQNANYIVNAVILLSASALLGGCGGGGGGGDGVSNVGFSASDPVVITPDNATEVASATFEATDGLTGNSEGVFGVLPASAGQLSAAQINVIKTIIQQAKRAPVFLSNDGAGVTPAATQTSQENCENGPNGSISGTFNDNDNDLTLSTGDTVSMTASNCDFGGVVMNGTISISNVVVSGDEISPPYSMQFRMQATDFSVTVSGETVVMSGDGTISESNSDGFNVSSSVSGNGIRITAAGETLTLTGYDILETENEATGEYAISINATISSSSVGGSVTVTTDVALSGIGSGDPSAGQVTCVGANSSSLTLKVVDSLNVQIEVDTDGIGGPDETLSLAWTAL
jgi:hypothetical protein